MMYPFFALAMVAPGRQRTFRRAVITHFLVLATAAVTIDRTDSPQKVLPLLGQLLLVGGIIEGAFLVGWRLTQLPKSQALEFLLVSPLRPKRVFLAEALVGLGRLALVTLAGLPVLVLLWVKGYLEPADLVLLMVMPYTWGAITGLGLTTWAYETLGVRRWGERLLMLGILFYLAVGVLAGENLKKWLEPFPREVSNLLIDSFTAFHLFNPFGVIDGWMQPVNISQAYREAEIMLERAVGLELAALVTVGLLLMRASSRLKGHFHDRHYRPMMDDIPADPDAVGDRPLSWWAVRRVMEYSGRVNLWLAGGFGILYAVYTLAEQYYWPSWMGRKVFEVFDHIGGIPVMTTALVVLAAVPAAFQYGLWDSNAQDRCRRLELLLLTELDARDYWNAAAAAAWRRGRGYFAVAVILWIAAAGSGKAHPLQVLSAGCAGVILWGLYFAVGFRAFSRGLQANGLGSLLTIGLPVLAFGFSKAGWPMLVSLMPPGAVWLAGVQGPSLAWMPGPVLGALAALLITRYALPHCDGELRHWYDLHQGRKVLE